MDRRDFSFRAASIVLGACTLGLLALMSCGTPSPDGGDNGGGDANADEGPSGNSDQDPVACCMSDGDCVVMPLVDCAFTSGAIVVEGVSSCSGDPCNRGACRSNGACVVTTEAECDNNYQGNATSCDSAPCVIGACCVEETPGIGNCLDATRDSCSNDFDGMWLGFDTSCEPTKPCGGDAIQGAVARTMVPAPLRTKRHVSCLIDLTLETESSA